MKIKEKAKEFFKDKENVGLCIMYGSIITGATIGVVIGTKRNQHNINEAYKRGWNSGTKSAISIVGNFLEAKNLKNEKDQLRSKINFEWII